MIGSALWRLAEQDREGDLRDAAIATYQVELDAYATAITQYEGCLSRIETRTANRARFIASALTKGRIIDVLVEATGASETDPYVIELRSLISTEIKEIDQDLPVLPRDTCPDTPPTRPIFDPSFGRTPVQT